MSSSMPPWGFGSSSWAALRSHLNQPQAHPYAGGGLYWILAGTVLTFVGATLNAWVLLVEILR
jgi:hypothetical protein